MLRTTMTAILAAGALSIPAGAATLFEVTLDAAQEVAPAGATGSPSVAAGTAELFLAQPGELVLRYSLTFDDVHDFGPVLGGAIPGVGDTAALTDDVIQAPDSPGIEGTDVTLLHVHEGARGVNGPVVYGLINPNQDVADDVFVTRTEGGFEVAGEYAFGVDGGGAGLSAGALLSATTGQDTPYYFNLHTVTDPAGAIRGQIVAANDAAAVPVPAALPLLAAGLGGLVLLRRRG